MSLLGQIEQGTIEAIVTLMGQEKIFHRVVGQIQRTEEALPGAPGKAKRAHFLEQCAIIFDELVIPILEEDLRILLQFGLKYLAAVAIKAE